MILAINTAQREHELALLDGGEILAEVSWLGSRDDADRLVPTLTRLLQEQGLDKKDIKDIVVVKGPGPYTAVRMGVSFANALAEGLGAQLHEISTFDLMVHKTASTEPVLAVLFAGGLNVAVFHKGEHQLGDLSRLLAPFSHDDFIVVSELPEALDTELNDICHEKNWKRVRGHELQTLGEAILTEGLALAVPVALVQEFYLRPPNITPSSNPWKKA